MADQNPDDKKLETVDIPAVEVFSEGVWNGDTYSHNDLQAMVDAFPLVGFEPTIKAGHADGQEDEKQARRVFGAPALGYAKRIWVDGKKLFAELKQVPKRFADLVKAGAFKRVSAEIYWNYKHEAGEKTYPRVLKSIAFLGVEIPALTDLKAIESLYHKNAAGALYAYDEKGNEFRSYSLEKQDEPNWGWFKSAMDRVLSYINRAESLKEYTIEKRDGKFCLIAKSTGKTLGCHDTEEGALAQERAVQANKNEETKMQIKEHMTREDVSKLCPPCAKQMEEKGLAALNFSAEQVAKFAEHGDMEKCMAKADMVEKYPDENARKTACGKAVGEAMMQAIQEVKGGPIMDEKKFQEEKTRLEADKAAAEKKAKEYQDKLAALETSNEEAKSKESEALKEVKKLKRERYDDQTKAWIATQKRAGKLAPVEEPKVVAIFSALYEDQRTVEFSQDGKETKKESLVETIKSFISGRPSIFREMSHADEEPGGGEFDNPGDELDRKTKDHMAKHGVKEYAIAWNAVLAQPENAELKIAYIRVQKQ